MPCPYAVPLEGGIAGVMGGNLLNAKCPAGSQGLGWSDVQQVASEVECMRDSPTPAHMFLVSDPHPFSLCGTHTFDSTIRLLAHADFDAALKAVESEFSAAEKELGATRKKAEEAAAAMKALELKDTKVCGGAQALGAGRAPGICMRV
jgi:hypothetical protein